MFKLKPDDPRTIDRYTITDVIGEGGMGRVYLGHHEGKLVAVKVMKWPVTADMTMRKRFRREIEAAKKVKGGFTAEVLDTGSDNGVLWYASEYIAGLTLAQAVNLALFDEAALAEFGYGLCKALKAIHAAGIIHRDIKPSNIILSPDGVKVVDFGIAAIQDDPILTRTGEIPGTVSYLSYEQARGMKLTPASDVFALGSVMVFAATGSPPFVGENSNAIMTAISDPTVQPNLERVPKDLRAIIAGCLIKNPITRSSLAHVERELVGKRKTTPASTEWMPASVGEKVQEATRIMTQRQEALTPTRIDKGFSKPTIPPKPITPAEPLGSFWPAVTWMTAIAIVFGLLWNAGSFKDDTTTDTPEPTTSAMPTVEVPAPAFAASKLKTTGNMAVTHVSVEGRQLHVRIWFNGTDEERKTAFAQSCAKGTYEEGSQVVFKPDKPNGDTPADVIEFRSLLDFPGKMYFSPKCTKNTIAGDQWLGTNKVPNDGFFGDEESLMPVIDAYTKGGKLKVVLPDYGTYDDTRYKAICLKTSKGAAAHPISLIRAINNKRTYVVLTYDQKQGTIYLRCSGKKAGFAGKGVAIP